MATFAAPKRPKLIKMKSLIQSDNPFAGKGDGKIYHLKPSEVGPEAAAPQRKYDQTTLGKIHEFRSMYGRPPIFGKPCDITLGDTIFEICSLCGYGAFGQVYRAQVKGKPQKQYALKVLLARSGRRYVPDREFKVISSLETKLFDNSVKAAHIVPFLAVAEHAQVQGMYTFKVQCGLVLMAFASNGELFDAIVKTDAVGEKTPNAFGSRFTRHLIRQAIFGLERLLTFGYTHRDLKPDNMLFDQQCNLVLCDLGHVKDLSEGEGTKVEGKSKADIVQTAMDRGTPRYTAPELVKAAIGGHRRLRYDSMKSDIWAIGITMFQLRSCICPMDVQDQLIKCTYEDLDVAASPGKGKLQPDEFDVDPYKSNAAMWKKWDTFHKNISPGGHWNSTAWCRDYINEQFSDDERAFINLLLQKDPRCRIRLDLLAKAARGDMTDVPKGLAWIAVNDAPSHEDFKLEMAKRIPGFGSNKVVQKRVSRRQLDDLGGLRGEISNKVEAASVIVSKLIAGGEFAVLGTKQDAAVEYIIENSAAKSAYGNPDQPAVVKFEDIRHRLRVVCTIHLDNDDKVHCQFSRARGDAVLHLHFMRKFDAAFEKPSSASPAAAPAASAASSTSLCKQMDVISENTEQTPPLPKSETMKDDPEMGDDDNDDYEDSEDDCLEGDD